MQALRFLEVHVEIRKNELDADVWQKPTNTVILLSFMQYVLMFGN